MDFTFNQYVIMLVIVMWHAAGVACIVMNVNAVRDGWPRGSLFWMILSCMVFTRVALFYGVPT